VVQRVVHEPQCVGSASSDTHAPPQFIWPGGHVDELTHVPIAHVSPVAHAMPHAPQFDGSLVVFTHDRLQATIPVEHCTSPAASMRRPESIGVPSAMAHAARDAANARKIKARSEGLIAPIVNGMKADVAREARGW
jgi:hypothetical protein